METVRTSDLYFAAYLKVACVNFVRVEREGRRVFFVFEKIESYEELKAQYFNRTAKVAALTYKDEIQVMKSLTYEE